MSYGYVYQKETCDLCGRKILVEAVINNATEENTITLKANCADCMRGNISDEFRQERPEVVEDLEEWV